MANDFFCEEVCVDALNNSDFNLSNYSVSNKEADQNFIEAANGIQFVFVCLFAGTVINYGSKKYQYPSSAVNFLFGMLVGLINYHTKWLNDYTAITRMDSYNMMTLFLPPMIFATAFKTDAHLFYQTLTQILILAVPVFVLCTVLTAAYSKLVLYSYNWSWYTAFLFGSIICATDPVAVVELLRELRMPESFIVLLDGESLLNDGIAIVMYDTFSYYILHNEEAFIADTVKEFCLTFTAGPLFGYVLAKVSEYIILRIYISPVSEVTVTVAFAFVVYFVVDTFFGLSAVLSLVAYTITLSSNKMCISPESENLINMIWSAFNFYADTLIFIICGEISTIKLLQSFQYNDAYLIIATYIFLTISRALTVILFFPALKKTGYGLDWKDTFIIVWGGLRGAFGLVLGLAFIQDPFIKPEYNADKVFVQLAAITILTLLINANTMKYFMKLMRFSQVTLVQRLSMGNAITCIKEVKKKSMRICERDWLYRGTNWNWVMQKTILKDPYKGGVYGDDPDLGSLYIPLGTCDKCTDDINPYNPSEEEYKDLAEAARKKVLRALKGDLWKQFRKGLIQRRSLKCLCSAIDVALDKPGVYLRAEKVSCFMKVGRSFNWLEEKTTYSIKKIKSENSIEDDFEDKVQSENLEGFQKLCHLAFFSVWFEPLVTLIIVLNVVLICLDIYFIHEDRDGSYKKRDDLRTYVSLFFILFYIWDTTVKVIALKLRGYIKLPWNICEFIVVLFAVVEGLVVIFQIRSHITDVVALYLRLIIAIRLLRALKVLKVFSLGVLRTFRENFSKELYHSYDVGRGFLFANDAVLQNIKEIVDFNPCADDPTKICQENIKQMIDLLDEFETRHPKVACAQKSNRAARRILNNIGKFIEHFREKAVIQRQDMMELNEMLFKMTKEVVFAPKVRRVVFDVPQLLDGVDWITDKDLIPKLTDNHTQVKFKKGQVIQEKGQLHKCVYIIASGVAQVVGNKEKKNGHNLYNCLPNTDTYMILDSEKDGQVTETLLVSSTIGLLGYLQQTKSLSSAICVKNCLLIQLDHAVLKKMSYEHANLAYSMWRNVAIHVAELELKYQPQYETYTDDEMQYCVQRGILPNLQGVSQWDVPDIVDDMVLVQGRVKDRIKSTQFDGPAYISNAYKNLWILDDVRKRPPVIILLLPEKHSSFHICKFWARLDDLEQDLCSVHNDSILTVMD